MRYFYIVLFFVFFAATEVGAQKVNRGFGWNFGIGPFYSESKNLVNFFPATTGENNIAIRQTHFGTNTSLHFYIKPAKAYQFGFQATSAFFPAVTTNNLIMQLHQYNGLLQCEFFVLNNQLNTVSIGGAAGTGGITADVRNTGSQTVKVRNVFIKPGEFACTSVPASTAGISLKFSKYFVAETLMKSNGKISSGSVLNLTSEAGILQNWYRASALQKTNNFIYYIKFGIGGGLFSFR